jgi:hypothetical protein
MLGRLAMVAGGAIVMLRRGTMVFSAFMCRHDGLPVQAWLKVGEYVGRP